MKISNLAKVNALNSERDQLQAQLERLGESPIIVRVEATIASAAAQGHSTPTSR